MLRPRSAGGIRADLAIGLILLTTIHTPWAKEAFHTDHRRTPKLVFSPSGHSASKPEAIARNYLEKESARFELPSDLANLGDPRIRKSLLASHIRYPQLIHGLPVDKAEIVVSVSHKDGSILRVFNNTYPVQAQPGEPKGAIAATRAQEIAWDHLRVHGPLEAPPSSQRCYVPEGEAFRLVYKTITTVAEPRGSWEHIIDATTGRIVSVRDERILRKPRPERSLSEWTDFFAAYKGPATDRNKALQSFDATRAKSATYAVESYVAGSGTVFDPDPMTTLMNDSLADSSPASAFTAAYVSRALPEITYSANFYTLTGPYIQIVNFETPATVPSKTSTGVWTATRGNNAFNDVMTFFHIDQNQRYMQSIGFTGAKAIQNNSIETDSDGVNGADNSHYLPSRNRLAFGHGGVDDNEDVDVILHEYWHAIQHDVNSNWGGADTGAMGEGFGDYWAASYSYSTPNGPSFHPAWAFTWDGHNSFWSGRNLDVLSGRYDPDLTYPDHMVVGGVNGDELWGTPIFQAFLELVSRGYSREEMDAIMLESQFGLGYGLKMRDMAGVVVDTARNLFPHGAHAAVYADKFAHHNILDAATHVSAPTLDPEPIATPGSSNQIAWSSGVTPTKQALTALACIEPATLSSTTEKAEPSHLTRPREKMVLPAAKGGTLQKARYPLEAFGAPTKSTPPATLIPNANWIDIKTEGFESAFPNSWTLDSNYMLGGELITWGADDYMASAGTMSGGSQCNVIDPTFEYPWTAPAGSQIECWMIYGPFDLSSATDAQVTFDLWYQLGSGDKFSWYASLDDADYHGTTLTGGLSGWSSRTFDLKSVPTLGNLCGQSSIYIAFVCIWDDVPENVDGPFLDEITIRMYSNASFPDLTGTLMTVPSSATEYYPVTIQANIANSGTASADASHATLFLSPANDTDTSDDHEVGSTPVAALGIGSSTWAQWDFRMPNMKDGTYTLWPLVQVDSQGEMPESDENNNIYKYPTGFTVAPAAVNFYGECDEDGGFASPLASGWTTQLNHTFEGLQPGTTYWYRVKAGVGPAGDRLESEWSNAESSTQNLPKGTPVWWMVANGYAGDLVALETADSDSDGHAAWEEWVAGTIPTDSGSVLRLLQVGNGAGTALIEWSSVSGRTYRVERATNISAGFSQAEGGVQATTDTTTWTDNNPPPANAFYRIVVD